MPYVRTKSRGRRKLIYERLAPIIWTQPGGIVWVGVTMWILIHLGLFGATQGYLPADHSGIPYELPSHRLRSTDIKRVLGGMPVNDSRGNLLIDPNAEHITIIVVDPNGRAETRFTSVPESDPTRYVQIIVPSTRATYQDVVTTLDSAARGYPQHLTRVWIAAATEAPD